MADERELRHTESKNPDDGESDTTSQSLKGAIEVAGIAVGDKTLRHDDASVTYYAGKNSALHLNNLMERLTHQLQHWRESNHVQSEGSRIFHERLGTDLRQWMREINETLDLIDSRLSAASRCILERQQNFGTTTEQVAAHLAYRNEAIGELGGRLEEVAQHMQVGFTWLGSQLSETLKQIEASEENIHAPEVADEDAALTREKFEEELSQIINLVERSFSSLESRLDSFHQSYLKHKDENVAQTKEIGSKIASLVSSYIDARESTKPAPRNYSRENKEVLRLGEMVQKRFIELNRKIDALTERLESQELSRPSENHRSPVITILVSAVLAVLLLLLLVLLWPQVHMFINRL